MGRFELYIDRDVSAGSNTNRLALTYALVPFFEPLGLNVEQQIPVRSNQNCAI